MKKLGVLFVILSFVVIFNACPPLEEDDPDSIYFGNVITIDEPLDSYKWFEILDNIAKEKRYVSLDLSKCTYKDKNEQGGLLKDGNLIIFDPFPAAASGKNYILSITLPAVAQIINPAVAEIETMDIDEIDDEINKNEENMENAKKHAAFRAFTNLRSVKADNVTLIGNFAFADCTELKEVIFPRVGHEVVLPAEYQKEKNYDIDIGRYAFLGCSGLKEVKFNSAAVIGGYAFKDCTSLSKVDFPEVWMIERNAFEKCESLANVFFEKVSKIGEEAFKGCTELKKAEFNVKPDRFTGTGAPTLVSDPKDPGYPCNYDSVIFYPSAFTGCKALEVVNVRRAWNVYFSKDVLANTGLAIDIYLYDELSTASNPTSYGHPQNAKFLGEGATVTVKKANIFVPIIDPDLKPAEDANIQGNRAANNIATHIRTNYTNIDVSVNPR